MDANNPEFKRKLLFIIALACGALALLMLYSYLNTQKEQSMKQIESMKQQLKDKESAGARSQVTAVLVAARQIAQGAVISSEDVAVREMPQEYLTPGALSAQANIIGLTALSPLSAGEQILQGKVGQPVKPKLLSAITPPGKRAVAVTVDSGMGGLQPGDYVDVLAVINPPEGSPLYSLAVSATDKNSRDTRTGRIVTFPLFQNVLVLSTGAEDKKDKPYLSKEGETVTLSLNPQEAALVAFVQEQGKIKLVMRSNSDMERSSVQAVNWDSLFEYLYPGSLERGMRKPATVEIYRGLQKETVALPIEGQNK